MDISEAVLMDDDAAAVEGKTIMKFSFLFRGAMVVSMRVTSRNRWHFATSRMR